MSGSASYYQGVAAEDAQQYGVPVPLFLGQIEQESGYNPSASNGNAEGIAQFEPSTAAELGIDPTNADQSLQAAAEYDAQLYNQTGSWAGALSAYGTTANGDAPALAQEAASYDLNAQSPTATAAETNGTTTGGVFSTIAGFFSNIEDYAVDGIAVLLGIVLVAGGLFLFSKTTTTIESNTE